jgi:hypothetical protein
LASDLIIDASEQFGDTITYSGGVVSVDGSRVTEEDWIRYIGGALKNLILVRPDARTKLVAHQLTADTTVQTLPDEALRLIDIVRNMGTDGLTPGYPITIIRKELLDDADYTWHTATAQSYIDHYMYNLEDPYRFWVTPIPSSAIYVDMIYSYVPTLPTAGSDDVDIRDVFWAPIIHWMLYKAFMIDDEAVNTEQAIHHFNGFYTALGQEVKAGAMASPKKKE